MKASEFDSFFEEKARRIFSESHNIIDIGGGLRIDRSNRKTIQTAWIIDLLPSVQYRVLDKVTDYKPDIVGDIHALPLPDNSVDAIFCMSVLEHVEEPQQAVHEMHRVLKPGGFCFIYAPFLFYYHPMDGYYKDFYRFTYDGMEYMTRHFSSVELHSVRGPLATTLNLIPFLSKRTGWVDRFDRFFRPNSRQVSGYSAFCTK